MFVEGHKLDNGELISGSVDFNLSDIIHKVGQDRSYQMSSQKELFVNRVRATFLEPDIAADVGICNFAPQLENTAVN